MNSSFDLGRTSGRDVYFRVVGEKGLVWKGYLVEGEGLKAMVVLTLAVTLPTPEFPPVTITTFPDRSGVSASENRGFPGKNSEEMDNNEPMLVIG